ncbi:MAG: hypothetical protein N2745_00755 [Syntrophorhabdaceae bacterium]|nr:hypothetical protein [Syntrophorhabdaceae bacterium]
MSHYKSNGSMEKKGQVARENTIRQYLIALLEEHVLSSRDLSTYLKIPEKEVLDHFEHIKISIRKNHQSIKIIPSRCEKCGFVFKKRERFSKPSKCPVCHSSFVSEPLFSIVDDKSHP